jgi:hypothetical protein
MIQMVNRSKLAKIRRTQARAKYSKKPLSGNTLSSDRFLLYSGLKVDELSALRILAGHLCLELVEESKVFARRLDPNVKYLVFSRIDAHIPLTQELLSNRIAAVEASIESQGAQSNMAWVGLVESKQTKTAQALIFPDIIPTENHFWLSDMSSIFAMDSDFWFHECLQRHSRREAVEIKGISESLAAILECTRWRFGRMELELFCRDLVRNASDEVTLGLHHLPIWFHHPILSFIETQLFESTHF